MQWWEKTLFSISRQIKFTVTLTNSMTVKFLILFNYFSIWNKHSTVTLLFKDQIRTTTTFISIWDVNIKTVIYINKLSAMSGLIIQPRTKMKTSLLLYVHYITLLYVHYVILRTRRHFKDWNMLKRYYLKKK